MILIKLLLIVASNSATLFYPVHSQLIEVYLQAQTVTLTGRVMAQGDAVPGATVEARNVQTNFSRTTTTDNQGFYHFRNLPLGRYAVEVSIAGFKQMRGELDVAADKNNGLNFKFDIGGGAYLTGSVEGKVTDEARKGIASARVTVREQGTDLTQEVTTDAEGNYEVSTLTPGKYQIVVEAPGFKRTSDKQVEVKEDKAKTQNFKLKKQ